MRPQIASVAIAPPEHTRSTAEILPWVDAWLVDEPERLRTKVKRLFEFSGVERRYSIFAPHEVFAPTSFAERNVLYVERLLPLAEQALKSALEAAQVSAQELDAIVTTSCTGITIPGMDAMLINRAGLRSEILRLPVFQMGCAGGVAGLTYAQKLVQSGAARHVAVLAIESPIATLQSGDRSMANLVSAAIFGDGVACAIVSASARCQVPRPCIVDAGMYHMPNTEHLMGFHLVESGLKMVLDPTVPAEIAAHLEAIVVPFLARNEVSIDQLQHFILHPGGRKILDLVETWLRPHEKAAPLSHQVLRDYGNMSSATVLYVLKAAMEQPIAAGTHGLMLSFGPGFTAQRALLQWADPR
jgi:alkylresorcinol/alkylpyrone synthase